ncbi:uncharacterized protein A1O9_07327 [Exophiala aquamarina CBS 119918]|uniref:Retinoic acid induced 16-like protein-domain-containing protein n=1 Tax=Exophiala aquamarina CBS 119918 TaxID=1182545 RepID=A0A072PBJ7_9EURO|nr:uncharacterized protein A1O9_07327 [Exophiala aquamarina CBS 119918]KEF57137.1 hypothetical protein A1O9_07327 [Exophiala aquamarina CBS 119918]
MDLLTRLIAGSGNSPTKRQSNTPAERLSTCKSICNALTHTWRSGKVEQEDESALTYTAKLLHRLEALLHDESRRAAPHSCLRYVASSQTYIIITKLAVSSRDVEIIGLSAQLFHVLINGEAEGLLDSKLFTRSLLDLVCYATIGGQVIVEERLQTDLVELLFEIATKIRSDPDILPAWFFPERENARGRTSADESRRSQFPLFYVLVQYVHHDGPVGDFARTALLYLTETASRFKPLETWMIESDLAPQMASGLGALYSRLSRQSNSLGTGAACIPIVALSDKPQPLQSISSPNPDAQNETKSFYSYLAFWQDTLNHCKSVEVRDTLLDHFQVLFVQQLLYPSLLESSDVEGGSTAAVISHLYRLLQALEHYQLVDRILSYLLASMNVPVEPREKGHRRQRMSVSRRKSIDHLKALVEVDDTPSPNLFNLLDLMVISLKSSHPETVNACLKLLSIIVSKHHSHVLSNLFRLEPASNLQLQRGVNQFNSNMIQLFDYAVAISEYDGMDSSYQGALLDGQIILEQHSCLSSSPDELDQGHRDLSIGRNCKLFEAIVSLLRNFFANDTITNLYLTEAIIAVTACEHLSLVGWFLPTEGQGHVEDNSSYNITFIISELIEQVRQWKSQFAEWDQLLARRRIDLAEEEPQERNLNRNRPFEQTRLTTLTTSQHHDSRSSSPTQSQSRPTTPRGRKVATTEFGSIDSTISKPAGHRMALAEHTIGRSPQRPALPADASKETENQLEASLRTQSKLAAVLRTQVQLVNTHAPEEASSSLPVLAGRMQTSSPGPSNLRLALPGSENSGTVTPSMQEEPVPRSQASVSHIITNAIILQEFILELAAMVQLRATFFDEVDLNVKVKDKE